MALINCSECEGKISDKSPACIHCGNPVTMPEPFIPEPIMFADLVDECGVMCVALDCEALNYVIWIMC